MNLTKKIALAFNGLLLALLPFSGTAAESARIESTINVRNTTTNTSYSPTTAAKVDDVVAVQVWYHNMEDAGSGKVANDLKVKINLPTTPGKVQTVTSTVSGSNTNTVTDNATVNLSLDRAYLEYIPSSAQWRHNTGTNTNINYVTQPISDAVMAGGVVLENAKPCFNFEATVTILARVRADVVSITKQVRKLGETNWQASNVVAKGDTLEYLITFKNEGNTVLKNVVVGDNMPAHVSYVAGTTKLRNGSNPGGISLTSNNITSGGIDVGDYAPGAVGYVWFQAKIDPNLAAGEYEFTNVGVVRPQGMSEHWNKAITKVSVPQETCVENCGGGTTPPPVPPTPVTPVQPLPETGIEGAAASAAGTGALGYSLRGWIRSKKSLLEALKGKSSSK